MLCRLSGVIFVAPGGHLLKDGDEVQAFFGERVFGAGRDFAKRFLRNDAVFFEVVEPLRKRAWVDATDGFL